MPGRLRRGIGRHPSRRHHFKSFNDTAGHQAADGCLKRVAGIIQSELRDYADDVFRFGGEDSSLFFAG
jgi:diguanylate cyclase (GGDEF)-like protein